ncbi:hypothetical protein FZEAL_7967, partial [Fusarium zealandicum]
MPEPMKHGAAPPAAPVGSSEAEDWYLPDKMLSRHPGKPHITMEDYEKQHKLSIQDPDTFWGKLARELLSWEADFHTVQRGSLAEGNIGWFLGGKLNASFNCVDRHALKNPDKIAIIHETDDGNGEHSITYGELLQQVSKVSWVLKDMGVRKGDTVAIYLPMIPEALVAMLACARIGAIHSVVFAGFSAGSLKDRILNAKSKVVITADEGQRGGKTIGIKKIVDEALTQCPGVQTLVYQRTGAHVSWDSERDHWWHEEVAKWPGYLPPEPMDAEDPLFLLYTSGSTGKPKGILHTTGGYLVGAAATGKYVFDIHDDDRHFCAGDVGWITGHTYVVYAPLLLGVPTVVFEGTPTYPGISRFWDIIEKHRITHFYVAPTALRLLKRAGSHPSDHDTESLRVLGSVGEPIAPEIWKWYHDTIGKGQCHVVDTYWQTETGSHVITPLAGVTPTKPGSACLPFFGIDTVLIDPVSGEEIQGNGVEGVLAFKSSWPSMARTVWRDHQRYQEAYLNVYKGYYFTGDGASRDQDGFYWIRGRVDDVINVSGHRLSTAEIEAAMVEHSAVAESAVVGIADELTGQAVVAFVCLKEAFRASEDSLRQELKQQVRSNIGPFAAPKNIFVVADLPKTRSGKIMRRVLRKVVMGEQDQLGDVTTLSDPSVVAKIIDVVHKSDMNYTTDDIVNAFRSRRLRYLRADKSDENLKEFIPRIRQDPAIYAMASPLMLQPTSQREFDSYLQSVVNSLLGVAICLLPDEHKDSNHNETGSETQPSQPTIIGIMCIGWGGISPSVSHHRNAEIGISLAKEYQGQGYGREAINWMLDWGFKHAGLHSIGITSASYNPKAEHLYQSIGFTLEGRRRGTIWQNRK